MLVRALAWLSTHLIVLTLGAFATTGYLLFGPPEIRPTADLATPGVGEARRERPVEPAPASASTAAVAREETPIDAERAAAAPAVQSAESQKAAVPVPPRPPSPAAPPRLIGGTLPVYPLKGHNSRETGLIGQPFRPPSMGQLPGAAEDPRERMVQAARRAYWNNEPDAAEAAYMALISRYPSDADAFGELGNLYQSMGIPDRAIDAFYEAGVRLKLSGEVEKLSIVRQILRNAQDPRAAELAPG